MKDKTKKQIMIGTIVVLIVVIIYLLLRAPQIETMLTNNGDSNTCSTNQVSGICTDGGTYICTTTCINRPPPTTFRPIDTDIPETTPERTCSEYAAKYNYGHFYYSTSITTDSSCRAHIYSNGCTAPMNIQVLNNCCLWNC